VVRRAALLAVAAVAATGCGDFESPEIVRDLRVLGMIASPPEVVTPIDPANPGGLSPADLGQSELCALVADPGESRRLSWQMVACPPRNDGRCIDGVPTLMVGEGTVDDPETADAPVSMCGELVGSGGLLAVLAESVRADDLGGFGNISVMVSLAVWPEDGDPAAAEFASKKMRYAPLLPADRVANSNPTLDAIRVARSAESGRGADFDLPLGRCGDIEAFVVAPGEKVQLIPREPDGAREDYVVPTFDGGERAFTENLSYQFYATDGEWSRSATGGPRDGSGLLPPLDTRWTAPTDAEAIGDGLDVPLWIIQRDERGGQAWFESCARVEP
jgi:hypothetical protein